MFVVWNSIRRGMKMDSGQAVSWSGGELVNGAKKTIHILYING